MKHPLSRALILVGSLLAAAPALAASPRDELLRLVPDDVGFCLVVQDLRGHWSALAGSPFARQVKDSAVGKAIRNSPEWGQLAEVEKMLREHLGLGWAELRDDIFGDAVVLAYRPGPPGKPEQEQGLLLIHARNAAVLAQTVERLNQAQKNLGELQKLEERQHNGVKYFHRVEQNHAPYFYFVKGPLLAASQQEEMLQQAIDRERQAGNPLARPFRQLGAEQALAALWLNPRAFDADMAARAEAAPAADAAFIKNLLVYWKALDDVVLTLTPGQQLEFTLGVRARTEALSPAARKVLAELARPAELPLATNDRTILTVAARVDFSAWLDTLIEFLPEDARRALVQSIGLGSGFGKIYRDMLGQLGPDAGFAIVAPARQEKQWTPHLLWALRVRPPAGGQSAQNILDGLNFLAGLAVLDYNSKHADRLTLKTEPDGDGEIKYFVHGTLYPPGWRPAYALKKDWLFFASSPDLIRGLKTATMALSSSGETPILQANLQALRTYVSERRDALIGFNVENQGLGKDEAGRRLDNLLTTLQFFDRIELTQRTETNQVILTLRVRSSQPLRK